MAIDLYQQLTEVASKSVPNVEVEQQSAEVISQSVAAVNLAQQTTEALSNSDVETSLLQQSLEALSKSDVDVILTQQTVEVLWKEQPTPEILAWGHNWTSEIKETLQWRTEVLTSRDGSERRAKLRRRARRFFSYKFTLSDRADAMGFLQWADDNVGREVMIPVLGQALNITTPIEQGATIIYNENQNIDDLFFTHLQPNETLMLEFFTDSFYAIETGEILIVHPDGTFQKNACERNTTLGVSGLGLYQPLARAMKPGSRVYPLLKGIFRQPPAVTHYGGKVIEATIDVEVASSYYLYTTDWGWAPSVELPSEQEQDFGVNYPIIFGWSTGNNWSEPHDYGFEPLLESFDNSLADPFTLRVNNRGNYTIKRRFYAVGDAEIGSLRGLLDYMAGRHKPVFLDEQVQGIKLTRDHLINEDTLIVENNNLGTWVSGPGFLVIRSNDIEDQRYTIKVSGSHLIDKNTVAINLSQQLPANLSKDAIITRLFLARLQHDAVDIIYKAAKVVEVNLNFQVLEEPAIDLFIEHNYWVPITCNYE